MKNRRPNRMLIALAAAVVVAGGAYFLQTESLLFPPSDVSAADFEVRPVTREPLNQDIAFPVLEHFKEIAERPLFSDSRRPPPPPPPPPPPIPRILPPPQVSQPEPPPPPAPPPPPPPERGQFSLVGVAISDTRRVAIVRIKKNSEIRQMVIGDGIDGWQLSEIGARSIRFMNGSHEHVVEIEEMAPPQQGPQAPGPAAKPPRPSSPALAPRANTPPPSR